MQKRSGVPAILDAMTSTTPPTAGPDLSRFATVAEAGAIVGKSAETVRRWIASGRLRAHHVADRVFVARADLKEAARDGRMTQTATTPAGAALLG